MWQQWLDVISDFMFIVCSVVTVVILFKMYRNFKLQTRYFMFICSFLKTYFQGGGRQTLSDYFLKQPKKKSPRVKP